MFAYWVGVDWVLKGTLEKTGRYGSINLEVVLTNFNLTYTEKVLIIVDLSPMRMTAPLRFFMMLILSSSLHGAWGASSDPVKVGIQLWPGYYPLLIAQHKGFFKELGLDLEYVLSEDYQQLSGMFNSKKIDLFCTPLGDGFALYDHDPSSKVVMVINESVGGDALLIKHPLAKVKRPIKIGTNLDRFGELFVRQYMKVHDLHDGDVEFIQQQGSQALDFLRSQKADIVHTWEPYVSELKLYYGTTSIFDSSQTPGLIIDALFANGSFLQARPKDMKKFISGWLKGAAWWLANRKEGDEYLEGKLLLLPGTLSLKGIKLFTLKDNINAFQDQEGSRSIYHSANIYREFFAYKQAFGQIPHSASDIVTGEYLP